MSRTRTCPRCKTDNPVERSNCVNCGGVMLGVGMGEGLGTPWVSDTSPADTYGEPQLPPALRKKLDAVAGLPPEKRQKVEELLLRAAARQQQTGAKPARGIGCAILVAILGVAMTAGMLLFFEASPDTPQKLLEQLGKPPHPPVPVVATLPEPASPTLADDIQPDPLAQPLVGQASAQPPGQTLSRDVLKPLRSCFRHYGKPATLPMSFGLEIGEDGHKVTVNVFAMTDVQVPPAVATCIQRHAIFLRLAHGVYFVDWPMDPDWP